MAKKKIDTPCSFAHDSNARNSAKIIKLRLALGAAGYGVYFMLLERLRESPGYVAEIDYQVLAFDLRESEELIRAVIEDFGLFILSDDGREFSCETLSRRLGAKFRSETEPVEEEKKEKADCPETTAEVAKEQPAETGVNTDPGLTMAALLEEAVQNEPLIERLAERFKCSYCYISSAMRTDFLPYCRAYGHTFATTDELEARFIAWMKGGMLLSC